MSAFYGALSALCILSAGFLALSGRPLCTFVMFAIGFAYLTSFTASLDNADEETTAKKSKR